MTERQLKSFTREELLQVMMDLSKENDDLRAENRFLRSKLDAMGELDVSGSFKETAARIGRIFDSAQRTAEDYVRTLKQMSADVKERVS